MHLALVVLVLDAGNGLPVLPFTAPSPLFWVLLWGLHSRFCLGACTEGVFGLVQISGPRDLKG